jgi:hypothetical protein
VMQTNESFKRSFFQELPASSFKQPEHFGSFTAQAAVAELGRQLLRHVRVVCCLNISLQAKCETGADLLGGGKTTGTSRHGGRDQYRTDCVCYFISYIIR